jgi:predicted RNA binding protein YcfA (HicA-like mRNA interferase family)
MTKLPRLTAAQTIRIIEKRGFTLSRQSGSHVIFKNEEGRRVTIPYHAGKILHPKLLKSILIDADISVQELLENLS